MHVRVLYHDNCFDGATSAALFSEFYRQRIDPRATFGFVGMNHGPGDVFAGAFIDGPDLEHVCVDFRYSADPRLGWWFDHHQSAFMNDADAAHFRSVQHSHHFYDPAAQSCSKFLADRCRSEFGFDDSAFSNLIAWADLIDGARFASPEQAVMCEESALQLMLWVEQNRDPSLKVRFIADLQTRTLDEIAAQSYVQIGIAPLLVQRDEVLTMLKDRAVLTDGVVTYDAVDKAHLQISKFAPYYLFPDAHYVVGLSALPGRTKISVGSNPWRSERRTANIATLCGRYGGGGHPAVGAVSLKTGEVETARQYAAEIASFLREAARQEG